jgi:hypothetical protein
MNQEPKPLQETPDPKLSRRPPTAEEIEMTDKMAQGPSPDAEPVFYYSLVLAEVIFSTIEGVTSHRCQLLSKADVPVFPANRLAQIQNSAANQVQGEVKAKDFKALEVILHGILPLGQMTNKQFWGSQGQPTEASPTAAAPQVDNVVPLQRP